jgi:hypothetical protein
MILIYWSYVQVSLYRCIIIKTNFDLSIYLFIITWNNTILVFHHTDTHTHSILHSKSVHDKQKHRLKWLDYQWLIIKTSSVWLSKGLIIKSKSSIMKSFNSKKGINTLQKSRKNLYRYPWCEKKIPHKGVTCWDTSSYDNVYPCFCQHSSPSCWIQGVTTYDTPRQWRPA